MHVSTEMQRLRQLSQPELREHLRTGDVVEITAAIREASDDELRAALDLDHFRAEGVVAILERFPAFADPERLGDIDGVVRFELARGRRDRECHTARFAGGTVTLAPEATPDVTIRADLVDFVRLVTGQSNAALLYLSDRLALEGDELLALDVGCVFTVPGSDQRAVDPRTLDPVDVATAVARSSAKHMRSVMAGSFRPIVLEEVTRRLPDFVDPRKAGDLRAVVGFRVSGRPDGEVDRFTVHLADGACRVERDAPEGQRRDATITIEGADFLRLATGQLHPVKGVVTGALKVRGDKGVALAFNGVMSPPQPRR